MQAQHSGDIRTYSWLSTEADEPYKNIEALKPKEQSTEPDQPPEGF